MDAVFLNWCSTKEQLLVQQITCSIVHPNSLLGNPIVPRYKILAVPDAVIGVPGIEWLFHNDLYPAAWYVQIRGCPTFTPNISIITLSFVSTRTIGCHDGREAHERAEGRIWLFLKLLLALETSLHSRGHGVFIKLHTLFHDPSLRPGLPVYRRLPLELKTSWKGTCLALEPYNLVLDFLTEVESGVSLHLHLLNPRQCTRRCQHGWLSQQHCGRLSQLSTPTDTTTIARPALRVGEARNSQDQSRGQSPYRCDEYLPPCCHGRTRTT